MNEPHAAGRRSPPRVWAWSVVARLGAVAAAAAPGSRRRRVALALRGFAESPAGAALWASTCAALLPVAYAYALARCAVDDYAANRVELRYYACDSAASVLTISFLCSLCTDSKHVLCVLLYLSLSAAASVGFAMHPLIAFWLMQHACADDRGHDFGRLGVSPPRGVRAKATEKIAHFQPTISYYGSELWQWLTFQELRHLEHHDFPRIAWTRLPQLENLAPEFYGRNGTYHVDSIRVLLESWLFNGERFDGERFDFACRHALLKESKDGTADPARVNIIWRAHARTK